MKKILTLLALVGATSLSYSQGLFNWQNSASTLISAGGSNTVNVAGQCYYAVFFGPSTTVVANGLTRPFNDSAFQAPAAMNTNAAAAGRLATRSGVDGGAASGSTLDFVIRGWSANAGTTWAEALANWNNGVPLASVGTGMFLGQTTVLDNFVLGGGPLPVPGLMGTTLPSAPGFNMDFYAAPEPSSMAIAGLGAASLLLFRRRK